MFHRYTELVQQATEQLCLKSWDRICDHAMRGFLFDEFVQGSRAFGTTVFRFVWPREKPELEDAIQNAARRVSVFVDHFLSRAQPLEGKGIWAEDRDWKRTIWPQPQYRIHLDQTIRWQRESVGYLCNVVVALNQYADSFRKHLQSDYLVTQGRFTVFDSFGVTTDDGRALRPHRIRSYARRLREHWKRKTACAIGRPTPTHRSSLQKPQRTSPLSCPQLMADPRKPLRPDYPAACPIPHMPPPTPRSNHAHALATFPLSCALSESAASFHERAFRESSLFVCI